MIISNMREEIKLIARLVIGLGLIVIGIISLPTPIPGLLIILFGLVVLGERRIVEKIKYYVKRWKKRKK